MSFSRRNNPITYEAPRAFAALTKSGGFTHRIARIVLPHCKPHRSCDIDSCRSELLQYLSYGARSILSLDQETCLLWHAR